MRLFPPPLEIGELEGFTKEKDIFGRSGIGKGLTNIVSQVDDPLVIAVDNEWGTGKTAFLKMWAGELRKSRIPVVYIDAFQNDYVEDAFTAIAGQIITLATERQKQDQPAAKRFLESSKGTAKILLRSGLKIGVKLGTAGILDAADFSGASAEISKEATDLEDKYLGELLTKQKQESVAIQSFRDALSVLPALLSPPENGEVTKQKPLVIIIDELDRCRPTFALQILERIKHFFSVAGVQFVLGTHLGQLQNSVSAVYGTGINSAKYLQKFISLTLHLTDSALHEHQRSTDIYVRHLFSLMELQGSPIAENYLRYLSHVRNLSLRSIEKIVSTLAISLAYRPTKAYCPDGIMVGLCVLKIVNPDVYVRARAGVQVFSDVTDALALVPVAGSRDEHTVTRMRRIWQFYSDPNVADDNPDFSGFGSGLWEYDLTRWSVVGHVARSIIDRFTH